MEKAKTRQQIARESGMSPKTLGRWLKKANIHVPVRDLVPPATLNEIYNRFGCPEMTNGG